jgi:hypothetical protein
MNRHGGRTTAAGAREAGVIWLVCVATLAMSACTSSSRSRSPSAETQQATSSTESAASSATSVATKTAPSRTVTPFPSALTGIWHAKIDRLDQKVSLSRSTYRIYTDPSDEAVGAVSIHGRDITFSGSDTCVGAGTYRWNIDNGKLYFTPVGTDGCPRSGILPGRSWTRR